MKKHVYKIELNTLTDVKNFVNIIVTSNLSSPELTDGDKYTINASSIMGVIYSLEWNNLFLVTTEDAYSLLKDYIVEATTRD